LLDASLALESHGPAPTGHFHSIVAHSFRATAAPASCSSGQPALAPQRLALISPMQDLDQHLQIFANYRADCPLPRAEAVCGPAWRRRLVGCPLPEAVCALRAVRATSMSTPSWSMTGTIR
jgi:hypothetical protein